MVVLKSTRARWLAALCMVGALACGSDSNEPKLSMVPVSNPETHAEGDAPGDAPEILSLQLDPAPPVPGERIRAHVRARNTDGTRPQLSYEWQVRGRILGRNQAAIMLPMLRKGDRVKVAVLAFEGHHESPPAIAEGTVPNRPPRIRDLRLRSREVGDEGEEWIAEVLADDFDDDPVTLDYTWLINDEPHEVKEAAFPTELLKRGDQLAIRVVASDGEDESPPAKSGVIFIANSAPEIVSQPPSLDGSELYSYQLAADDADGDRALRWELVEGPRGMMLDTHSGLITWRPRPSQDGSHRIEVAVEDGRGGRSTQIFGIAIVVEFAPAPAALR
jgi:hypothetical protein